MIAPAVGSARGGCVIGSATLFFGAAGAGLRQEKALRGGKYVGSSSVRRWTLPVVAVAVVMALAASVAQAKKAAPKGLTVCKHGCVFTTIQKAVNASGRNATIKVKPGKYVEGVIEGKHARGPGGPAQNGVDGENVNNLDLENMKAEHFEANGFFINTCHGYLMKNLVAGFNHSYGLYVFKCVGGRMTQSVGYGNGDSAFYV